MTEHQAQGQGTTGANAGPAASTEGRLVGRRFRVVSSWGLEDSRATLAGASAQACVIAADYRKSGDHRAAESVRVVDSQPWRKANPVSTPVQYAPVWCKAFYG